MWVEYFNGITVPASRRLDDLLEDEPIAVRGVVLTEVLQGFRHDRDYRTANELLASLTVGEMRGQHFAIRAADNFRQLRSLGVTVRKTIDIIIATACIENRLLVVYADRDFEDGIDRCGPFERHP